MQDPTLTTTAYHLQEKLLKFYTLVVPFCLTRTGIINETSIYITIIYCILAIFVFISKDYLIIIVNNNTDVLSLASSMIVFFLIANIPSMSTYIYQSGLQALGKSKFVLYSTAIINLITLVLMIIFVHIFTMGLIGVAVCKFFNELATYFVYRRMFSKNKTTDVVTCK